MTSQFNLKDAEFMQLALDLAKQGEFTATPNPAREIKLEINNNTALMKNTLNTPSPKTILILFFSIDSILSRKTFVSYSHRCTY